MCASNRTYGPPDECKSALSLTSTGPGRASVERRRRARSLGGDSGFRLSARPSLVVHAPERRQRLADDLVHVVITVCGEPPDEGDIAGRIRQLFVLLEQLLIFRPRDRIIGITFGRRILIGDRRHRRLLPGQVLVLADTRERHVFGGIVDDRNFLELLLIERLVVE